MRDLLKTYRQMRSQAVVIKHADRYTHGIPDMSVTDLGYTSWWEIKHANPDFESKGVQELTALRLATAGSCYYVIYAEKPTKCVLIVHPKNISDWMTAFTAATHEFDHKWVVDFITKMHQTVMQRSTT